MQRREGLKQAIRVGLWAAAPLAVGAVSLPLAAAGNDRAPAPPLEAQNLMRLVRGAGEQHNFSGTYVVTSGTGMTSSRIVHLCDGHNQIERIEALDGQARQVFRYNEAVHVFWPSTREASIEQRHFIRFPLQASRADMPALTMYDVIDAGHERIAGQEAQVVTFRAKDGLRFAQRWWIDRKTGLLLRADTLGVQGEVVESAAFSEIQFSTRQTASALLQEMNRLDGYRVFRPLIEATDLEHEGWALRNPVAGFQPVSSVRRHRMRVTASASMQSLAASAMALAETPPTASTTPPAMASSVSGMVIQSIFSDGLTHVSLFIEPFAMHPNRSEKFLSAGGATHVVSRRHGDWWITAVGDVPAETLAQFAAAIERRKP